MVKDDRQCHSLQYPSIHGHTITTRGKVTIKLEVELAARGDNRDLREANNATPRRELVHGRMFHDLLVEGLDTGGALLALVVVGGWRHIEFDLGHHVNIFAKVGVVLVKLEKDIVLVHRHLTIPAWSACVHSTWGSGVGLLNIREVNVHHVVALRGGLRLALGFEVEHLATDVDSTPVESGATHGDLQEPTIKNTMSTALEPRASSRADRREAAHLLEFDLPEVLLAEVGESLLILVAPSAIVVSAGGSCEQAAQLFSPQGGNHRSACCRSR